MNIEPFGKPLGQMSKERWDEIAPYRDPHGPHTCAYGCYGFPQKTRIMEIKISSSNIYAKEDRVFEISIICDNCGGIDDVDVREVDLMAWAVRDYQHFSEMVRRKRHGN